MTTTATYSKGGRRLAFLRSMRDWTQAYLAKLADTDQTTICAIERGRYKMGKSMIDRLCKVFGVDEETLLGDKDVDYDEFL